MTTTAHEDQLTDAPEPARQPYDTGSILRRNVADLELALKQQTERAEAAEEKLTTAREDMQSWIDSRNGWMERAGAAEAELARLREQKQKPMGWIDADGDFYHGRHYPNVWPTAIPVYVEPTPAPAVPYGVDEEAANRIALAVYDCKNDICPEPLLYAINRILATEAHPLSVEGRDALLPSAPQAPAVPELDPMTRLIVSDPKQPKPTALQAPAVPEFCAVEAQLTLAETEMLNAKAWSAGTQAKRHIDFAITAIGCTRDLLQSRAVKDFLTSQAYCRACVNRGRVNGLSQETYCESCVHEGRNWRKNHFLDAAADRLLEGGK